MGKKHLDFKKLTIEGERITSLGFVGDASFTALLRELLFTKNVDIIRAVDDLENSLQFRSETFGAFKATVIIYTSGLRYQIDVRDECRVKLTKTPRRKPSGDVRSQGT